MKSFLILILISFTFIYALKADGVNDSCTVAYYSFDGDSKNTKGTAKDGVNYNATLTTGHEGISNTAYLFNKTSSIIEVPHSNAFDFTNEITLSGWFRVDAFTMAFQ